MVGSTIFEQNIRDMSFVSMFYNSLSTIYDFSAKFDNFAKKSNHCVMLGWQSTFLIKISLNKIIALVQMCKL